MGEVSALLNALLVYPNLKGYIKATNSNHVTNTHTQIIFKNITKRCHMQLHKIQLKLAKTLVTLKKLLFCPISPRGYYVPRLILSLDSWVNVMHRVRTNDKRPTLTKILSVKTVCVTYSVISITHWAQNTPVSTSSNNQQQQVT